MTRWRHGMQEQSLYHWHMPKLEFHEVDAARWGDFERLFESRGGPKSCWCIVWRAGAKTNKGVDRKFAIHRYVSNGTPIGLLGYSEGEPVAWCSIAPRPTYRDLGGPSRAGELPEQVWSLACFFIRRDLRGQELTKQIIEAAVQHAEKHGATVIERIQSIQAPPAIALWDTYRRSYR